jgi:hypothetical protein
MPASSLTYPQLRAISLAYRNFKEQDHRTRRPVSPGQATIDKLTGNFDRITGKPFEPPVIDLMAIWHAAQADPGNPSAPHSGMFQEPRVFLDRFSHWEGPREEPGDGRILVDAALAFTYCQHCDSRVMLTAFEQMDAAHLEDAATDPLGHAVRSAKGGPIVMAMARDATRYLGLDDDEFREAVLKRAKEDAASMDEFSAERLLADVRRALHDDPGIELPYEPND